MKQSNIIKPESIIKPDKKKKRMKSIINRNKSKIFINNNNNTKMKSTKFFNLVKTVVPDILNVYRKSNKNKKKTKTLISVALDYFNDDYTENFNRQLLGKNAYYYNEYKCNFNFNIFVEFFLYHILFFLVFGPFVIIVMNLKKGGYNVGKNLMFFNYNKIFFIQFIQYLFLFSSFIFGLVLKFNLFDSAFYYTLIQAIIFRIISIAGKYSSFNSNYIKKIRETKITLEDLYSKLLLNKWKNQDKDLIKNQIMYCLDRNEIEDNYFYISFLYNPNENFYEKSKFSKDFVEINKIKNLELHFFSCKEIFKYLNDRYYKTINFKKYNIIIYLLTFIRVLIPVFFIILDNKLKKKPLIDFLWNTPIYQILIFLLCSNILIMLYMAFFNFFFQFIIDVRRMKYILNQLTEMIQIKKINLKNNLKYFPTINIFSVFTLNNWGNLRKLVNDYGTDYLLRNKIYVASVSFIWLYLFIFLIIIEYLNESIKNRISVFEHTIIFEFFLIFILLLILIYQGASYNAIFSSHINKLTYIKILLKRYKSFKNLFNNENGEENRFSKLFNKNWNSNFLYLKFDNILKNILENYKDIDSDDYIDKIIVEIDNLIELVKNEESMKSINIFGIVLNYEIFNILIGGLLPIILQILKEYFQRNFN